MPVVNLCDFGVGNSVNVKRAFNKAGAEVEICNNGTQLTDAKLIIVPGVGAFSHCMNRFRELGFDTALHTAINNGAWVLGICVGMQMFADSSEEFGDHKGLGLIPGSVRKIGSENYEKPKSKLPHVGWSTIEPNDEKPAIDELELFVDARTFYFVHSYTFHTKDAVNRIASTTYGHHDITAAVRKDRVIGVQFHPEMSGQCGIEFIRAFLAKTMS